MDEEMQDEQPKRAKPQPVPVTVLGTEGGSALVEWVEEGQAHRAYIPVEKVKDGTASKTTLSRGVLYGLPWEKVKLAATADALAAELRRRGIWTGEDLRTNINAAIGALQATYRVDVAALMELAKRQQEATK